MKLKAGLIKNSSKVSENVKAVAKTAIIAATVVGGVEAGKAIYNYATKDKKEEKKEEKAEEPKTYPINKKNNS